MRRDRLLAHPGHRHVEARLEEPGRPARLMEETRPEIVLHLAAQAGVRHSIAAPRDQFDANIAGTLALLEAARAHPPRHLPIVSTSSANGAAAEMPCRETQRADHQISFHAATRKAAEAMAHAQSHIHGLPVTMSRFLPSMGPGGGLTGRSSASWRRSGRAGRSRSTPRAGCGATSPVWTIW